MSTYTAFLGTQQLVSGELKSVLLACKPRVDEDRADGLLIVEDASGRQVEFDFRGSREELLARELPPELKSGPGRPKLGVSSREVSLLPRHWDWLERQPNGISAALRRLIEAEIKQRPDRERVRAARDATVRAMTILAGNEAGYEEASRALYAGDEKAFARQIRAFPKDVRAYVERLAAPSFAGASGRANLE